MTCLLAQSDGLATQALFYVLAAMSAVSAFGVVVSQNIVRMAVCLLFTLVGVAGLYFLMHAEFIAAVQIVVYAGGTLILIVFGIMLTSKSPFVRLEPKRLEVIVATCVAAVVFAALAVGLHRAIAAGLFPSDPTPAGEAYPVARLGQALIGDYLIPFEIASVLLLMVMIGAAYLAKARKRTGEEK